MIFMGAFDNVACPIVEHCRTLSNIVVLTTRGLDIFVFNDKGLDNFVFNNNSDNGRQYY